MLTAYRTDIGKVRLINEDRAAIQTGLNGFTLAILADGMGGHQAGEIASKMAVELIQAHLLAIHKDLSDEQRPEAIRRSIVQANETVFEFALNQQRYYGMGTTVVVALASVQDLTIGHIGDSRAYLWQSGRLRQVTEDHTLVNELMKSGQITASEASTHPHRNALTRALGTEKRAEADVTRQQWNLGDILLICSDGLSGLVEDSVIGQVLAAERELEWKADELIRLALEEGGGDNVTVVLLENKEANEASEDRGDDE
ncbi:Stp1/IreP family PP2C-type Ser/Thr phosphatase [Paenibacillus koleovorans]|uniref:Stp1/IreP family PP2C-type Ser/Thr phosphatase n=1 Tax=Paenibacillus koleovorans TaxID=121608 RepID=UPI000FD9BAD3|nr:Stp1/IreP family PP2C-type Ser/Thr phosphatase [Paenibacillus koleovorans]